MFELANKLIGIYKTFDITKSVIFDSFSFDVKGNQNNKNNKKKL